jgi:hypothetical protein
MPSTSVRPRLNVEGTDDEHVIRNLVKAHGIEYRDDPRVPDVKVIEGITNLLDGIEDGVRASTGRAVGFVLDADSPILDRWRSVRDRLLKAGVDAVPQAPPPEGFIGMSSRFKSRAGVWLMPDNQQDGDLESFLRLLVRAGDPILPHADEATGKAKGLGAAFAEVDHRKAIIHAWLAWQSNPGCPYGTAITAQFFAHDADLAMRFVQWYVRLFGPSTTVGP